MIPPLSIGFMGLFGRSPALRTFDADLRALDLHPKLVPEAVKLAALRILMAKTDGATLLDNDSKAAAELLAYCMVGAEPFATANGIHLTQSVEKRIDLALDDDTSSDARLILLALHANVIQPSVIEHYRLETDSG
ncbi:hypothetical protein [Methyloceanibacter caenitepidi]|uniref:Uncharacterized protein n=1 Tax=Methyloceanibacter caenitepidi TaxID=1384459 RepID=A0A0A8K157_9HYPH|nr:hypothetical protein [Methyloceanibacter caenitepidi]BAQ16516.1 hypothetical protein GL4_1056 [Methyloceanibacter caenitepidi]